MKAILLALTMLGFVSVAHAQSGPGASVAENAAKAPLLNPVFPQTLGVLGADSSAISTQTAAFTFDATMHTIDASTAAGQFAATLPACVTALSGRVYDLVKFDASTNAVTLTAATTNAQTSVADTISGAATVALTTQWTAATVKCNGAGVWIRGASL